MLLRDYDDLLAQLRKEKELNIIRSLLYKPKSLATFFEEEEPPDEDEMLKAVGAAFGIIAEDPVCQNYYNQIILDGIGDFASGGEDDLWFDDYADEDDFFFDGPNGFSHFDSPAAPARSQKVGRNEPCPCGSGKKYKHCCGRS